MENTAAFHASSLLKVEELILSKLVLTLTQFISNNIHVIKIFIIFNLFHNHHHQGQEGLPKKGVVLTENFF